MTESMEIEVIIPEALQDYPDYIVTKDLKLEVDLLVEEVEEGGREAEVADVLQLPGHPQRLLRPLTRHPVAVLLCSWPSDLILPRLL